MQSGVRVAASAQRRAQPLVRAASGRPHQTELSAPNLTTSWNSNCEIQTAPQEWKEQVKKYPMDLPNMKALYDTIDVIGVSGARGDDARAGDAPVTCPAGRAARGLLLSVPKRAWIGG